MKTVNQSGYLIIADISGYTSYIARSEIENAQALLAELLTRIVEQFKPILNLSRLEGDAVFAYTTKPLNGETLLELIDATYIAFREGQELYRGNLCNCEACLSLPALDLKFIVHYGEFAIQRVSGFLELVGSDVNLVHRLLKNHVAKATGWQAYALFTEMALNQANLQLDGSFAQTETYAHLGRVNTFAANLSLRYQRFLDSQRVMVTEQDADLIIGQETSLPPHEVWEWLTAPSHRVIWESINEIELSKGQREIGGQSRCMGEQRIFIETILDWKPFNYYSTLRIPQTGSTKNLLLGTISTFKLKRTESGGTQLQIYCKVKAPLPRWVTRYIARYLLRLMKTDEAYNNLTRTLINSEKQKILATVPQL